MWSPITLDELNELIAKEIPAEEPQLRLWELVRISPAKWSEPAYGEEGGGFWAVGLLGSNVIWYNDIEDGFNVSPYSVYGQIDEYSCDQSELWLVLSRLVRMIQTGEQPLRRGGPQSLPSD